MFAISSSQKKTVFAVILLALIAVGVMVSGRGGLSGLRSDFINNPGFVCTNESLVSGEVRHSGAAVDMQKFSAEKAGLQEKVQGWNSGIRKNEALIKKLEKQKTAAEKKQRTLEVAVKKQCTPRALTTCSAKKKELQIIQQNIQKFQSSLINVTAQNKKLRIDIQTALSNIKLLETQILEIQNFKEDYETCKRSHENDPVVNEYTGFRFASWECYNGEKQENDSISSCKSESDWREDAEDYCKNKCAPGSQKCGVNNFGSSEACTAPTPTPTPTPAPAPVATCDSLTVTPTSVTNGREFTYTCTGTNATSYSVAVYRAGGALFFSGTDRSGSFTLPATPTGSYTVQCFVNDQGGSSPACQKTVENTTTPAPVPVPTPVATCNSLTVTPTNTVNGGNVTYTCSGTNAESYRIVAGEGSSVLFSSTDQSGSFTIPSFARAGTYNVRCFVNDQGGTSAACQKTVENAAPAPVPVPVATCDSLTVTPTNTVNGGNVTYTCTGTNATSYSVAVYRAGGALFFSGTDRSGSFTLPATPTGSYTVQCFVNDQGGSSPACQKTVENAAPAPAPAPGKLTVSVDSSTPPSRLLLDNMQEHSVAVFRLAASITENLDVDSIKITDAGTNGNDVVAYYRFYNSRGDFLGSAAPDGDGNAELFLTNGSLVIPANDYKLVTVKAVIRDIDGIGFQNGDTLKATIAQAADIKATGTTSRVVINSAQTNIEGNTMTTYEAYPVVSFAPDTGRIGSAITLSANQLIAKIAVSNPGDKDVTFQAGDGNKFSIQVQTVGDNTNTADETITLKDQDGITLDTGGAPSSFGVTQVDFDMSSVGANGTTIPSRSTKYFYIYANTTDLEDSSDRIQVWLDDTAADVTFGINGAGAFAVGAIINRGDQFGPILSRPN